MITQNAEFVAQNDGGLAYQQDVAFVDIFRGIPKANEQQKFSSSVSSSGDLTMTPAGTIVFTPVDAASTGNVTLTVSGGLTVAATFSEAAVITMTLTPVLTIYASVSETAHIANFLAYVSEVYDVLCVTLDAGREGKLYPAYRFSNFNFNSFARIGNKTYAAGEGGIYVLGDFDDDGTQIKAFAKTGKSMTGTERNKRITHGYVIGTSDRPMQIDVEVSGKTHTYEAVSSNTPDATRQKIKFGRGSQGGVWQFTLKNRDGSDFDIQDLLVKPEPLSRRDR